VVCFWNALGNRTLTDIAFSHEPQRLVHGVAFFHKIFKVGQPRTDGLVLFIGVLQAVGGLQSVAGDASDGELIGLNAAMCIEPRGDGSGDAAAVSVNTPSVSASSWMAETISTSDTSSAHPPDSRNGARGVRPVCRIADGQRPGNGVGPLRLNRFGSLLHRCRDGQHPVAARRRT